MEGILGLLYSKHTSSLHLKLYAYQVQNVDPIVTTAELGTFFSYCGTVEKIQLQRNKEGSQSAQVTFTQPFAFRTALLLDNCMVARQPIRVSPSENSTTKFPTIKLEGDTKDDQEQARLVSVVLRPNEAMTQGGATNILDRTRNKMEKYKLSEKGRVLVDQTCCAIHTTINAAQVFGTLLMDDPCIGTCLMLLYGALYKAAKYVSQAVARKRNSPSETQTITPLT